MVQGDAIMIYYDRRYVQNCVILYMCYPVTNDTDEFFIGTNIKKFVLSTHKSVSLKTDPILHQTVPVYVYL